MFWEFLNPAFVNISCGPAKDLLHKEVSYFCWASPADGRTTICRGEDHVVKGVYFDALDGGAREISQNPIAHWSPEHSVRTTFLLLHYAQPISFSSVFLPYVGLGSYNWYHIQVNQKSTCTAAHSFQKWHTSTQRWQHSRRI